MIIIILKQTEFWYWNSICIRQISKFRYQDRIGSENMWIGAALVEVRCAGAGLTEDEVDQDVLILVCR